MEIIFEVLDKTRRRIRLTKKQWAHIKQHHAEIENPEEIEKTLQNPDSIILDEREDVENFFKFFKHKKQKSKFLKVIVRFLNTESYVITAYFVRTIK
ncbi:hypothetical protein FP803_04835 [Candidatus Woesearchaeota archaeon]|nr:hypothetical protein [Candidatus Woesearchaeota archaeon]